MLVILTPTAHAEQATLAVASNFLNPVKELAERFARTGTHRVDISSGSTGKLYTQITNGAPFDAFLAANEREPQRLEDEGYGVVGSRFTYAIGKLVVWSADDKRVEGDCASVLKANDYEKLSIANPRTAPYGKQAVAVLNKLGIYAAVEGKLVTGNNITQAFQYVSTRNAELGIVSLSQVRDPNNAITGSHCVVDQALYEPLVQQAVLLEHGKENLAAQAFLHFLRSASSQQLIQRYGYELP